MALLIATAIKCSSASGSMAPKEPIKPKESSSTVNVEKLLAFAITSITREFYQAKKTLLVNEIAHYNVPFATSVSLPPLPSDTEVSDDVVNQLRTVYKLNITLNWTEDIILKLKAEIENQERELQKLSENIQSPAISGSTTKNHTFNLEGLYKWTRLSTLDALLKNHLNGLKQELSDLENSIPLIEAQRSNAEMTLKNTVDSLINSNQMSMNSYEQILNHFSPLLTLLYRIEQTTHYVEKHTRRIEELEEEMNAKINLLRQP